MRTTCEWPLGQQYTLKSVTIYAYISPLQKSSPISLKVVSLSAFGSGTIGLKVSFSLWPIVLTLQI
jgi:hypothetical protein